jgi:hypothetical protein
LEEKCIRKTFDTMEERLKVYETLLNLDEENEEDLSQAITVISSS